jgi:Zn-dependent protease
MACAPSGIDLGSLPQNVSLKLGNVFGIPVRLHWTFLVLTYVLLLNGDGPFLWNAFVLATLFGSVLLHELGHSLAARMFGIHVLDITFWPLGGMARMAEMPESARVEGIVALAGPAVNFVLALLGLGLIGLGASNGIGLTYFVYINLSMGIFNLIPAFPMDGGRILRALFALRADWLRATERAVAVGRWIAGFLFLVSILFAFRYPQLLGFALVAGFVWLAGGRELLAVRLRRMRAPYGTPEEATPPWYRYRAASPEPAPVPADREPRGARRPHLWEFHAGPTLGEDAIRDLERYRGRLRRRVDEDPA